ncbi:hypothetical protein BASA50_009334 [Batrachochytrium salamandrivorans]|uniref:CSN8/PSMD8/EIF3K domain-containing protein n=1 Tax=Batrachochytrium salamandrivorans TaxID=1357716 RepID=A0ABQ8F2F6_9FUNG|nr:hypothetical protein BASA60_008461 [Batrachochytrium salamandrivorans]KAH6570760.1 hypothetical protein BASA62_004175 [Batrachochytrium salamandrivorans]KAH6586594.1 hypothetical protein BASA61_006510 [Batrachochytrium salamandrivorans]KAH6590359.1 hypothetical protein BASA50_009334 [Batrachochytrium salamandrivorans]KAH9255001.1 hypothetical protein BASA81_006946 [Batrachochytrium salamandrivorans]
MSVDTSSLAGLVATNNVAQLAKTCEILEMEQDLYIACGSQSNPNPIVVTALLAAYIILNDLVAAKYLIQRTPPRCRSTTFLALAAIAIHAWKRDLEAVHIALDSMAASGGATPTTATANSSSSLSSDQAPTTVMTLSTPHRINGPKSEPSETVWMQQLLIQVREAVRRRALELVARAYSSLPVAHFAAMVGVSIDQAEQHAAELGWQCDGTYIYPIAFASSTTTAALATSSPTAASATMTGPIATCSQGTIAHGRPGIDRIALLANYSVQLDL